MSTYSIGSRKLFIDAQHSQGAVAISMALLAFLLGVGLGWAGWGEGRAPALAAMLPLVVALSRTRAQAFMVAAGYSVGVLREVPAFISSWFDGDLRIGAGALLAYALIGGVTWCLGFSRSPKPWRGALAVCIGWTVALLPPVTVGIAGHPVIAWGALAPGWGWVGVALSVAVPAALVYLLRAYRTAARYQAALLVALAALLATVGLLRDESHSSYAGSAVGVTTQWGKTSGKIDDVLDRVSSMGAMAKTLAAESRVTTVLWPESIVGEYNPALYPVLNIELLKPARASGQTHIVGMDLPLKDKRFENAAVAFYPDGRSSRVVARQPAPVSLWRPWDPVGSFTADWQGVNVLALGGGLRGAVIFCYEEYLPALYLINEARDDFEVYVAMTNTWAAESELASLIQTKHSLGMARLFGRPYLKAENRPAL